MEEGEEGIGVGVGAAVAAGTGGENMIDYWQVASIAHLRGVLKSNLQNAAGAQKILLKLGYGGEKYSYEYVLGGLDPALS